MTNCIYALCRERDGKIFYIGRTNNLERRLIEHDKKFGYIGFVPKILEDNVSFLYIPAIERWWINWALKHDQPLLNKIVPCYDLRDPVCQTCGQICGYTLRGGCKNIA